MGEAWGTLTLWLLLIRRDGADEVLWRHVYLGVAVLADDLQSGEVAEDLVRGGVGSDTVLVLHHLHQEQWQYRLVSELMPAYKMTLCNTIYYTSQFNNNQTTRKYQTEHGTLHKGDVTMKNQKVKGKYI